MAAGRAANGEGVQQCQAGAGGGGRLLGGLLLHAASRFTSTVTLHGGIEGWSWDGPLPAWWAVGLRLLPGRSGHRQHGFHMLPADGGHTASCMSLVEAVAGYPLWAWTQALHFCRPSLVSHVAWSSLVGWSQARGMFCCLFLQATLARPHQERGGRRAAATPCLGGPRRWRRQL